MAISEKMLIKKKFLGKEKLASRKKLLDGKWIEVMLPVIIVLNMLACIPSVAAAGSAGQAAGDGLGQAVEITGQTAESAVRNSGNTGQDLENDGQVAEVTDTAYRIQPLIDKLAAMDSASIEAIAGRYADMGGHWSRSIVGKLTALDILAGSNGKFMPDSPVQADQFIKMAVAAMGYKVEQGKDYWAQPYIDIAISEGIVLEGEFEDYKKPLSREQMARIIVRTALKVDEKPDDLYDRYIIGKIMDYESIADSLKQFVIDGYKLGLITGSGNKFHPKGTLTRAEASTVIIRMLDRTERKPMRPGEDEIIRLNDSRGNPVVLYPGVVRELFTVAKAAQDAIPKAKGYVRYYIGADGKFVTAKMYKDKAAYEASIYDKVAAFNIAFNDKESTYAYDLTVWNDKAYKEYFPDYIREIFKTIYEKDAQKAIALHDKYMNARYTRTDGYNDYTVTYINNRNSCFLRYDDYSFGIQIKLKGLK